MDCMVTKVNNLDGTVNDQENGLVCENSKLKEEIQVLMRTCKAYEDRFVEMESEVQVITLKIGPNFHPEGIKYFVHISSIS